MTRGVVVVIYWGRSLLIFLEPLSKCSWWLPNVFFITLHPITFVSVYDCTFLENRIFILWIHKEVFDGKSFFEVHWYPIFSAWSFNVFTEPFVIWNHHVYILVVLVVISSQFVVTSIFVLGGCLALDLHSVQAHVGYLHLLRAWKRCCSSSCNNCGLEQMVFCSVIESAHYTVFWWVLYGGCPTASTGQCG